MFARETEVFAVFSEPEKVAVVFAPTVPLDSDSFAEVVIAVPSGPVIVKRIFADALVKVRGPLLRFRTSTSGVISETTRIVDAFQRAEVGVEFGKSELFRERIALGFNGRGIRDRLTAHTPTTPIVSRAESNRSRLFFIRCICLILFMTK